MHYGIVWNGNGLKIALSISRKIGEHIMLYLCGLLYSFLREWVKILFTDTWGDVHDKLLSEKTSCRAMLKCKPSFF